MEDFKIKLNLVIDILREKNSKLKTLAIITENQGTVLGSSQKTSESVEMLTQLIEEKQKLIDEILGYDDVFLKTYDQIKDEFEKEEVRKLYRDEILEMQELIVSISEGNEKIIVLERSNDEIVKSLRNNIERQASIENKKNSENQGNITNNNTQNNVAQAPMSNEFQTSGANILSGTRNVSKVTNKPIATLDLKAELEKSNNTRNSLMTGRQETGKRYKLKSVIEQYKSNKR